MSEKNLNSIIRGEIRNDEVTRSFYDHDYSIFKVKPEAVIFPKNSEDIKQLVKFVSRSREGGEAISLTARSGGTDMTGGPLTDSLLLVFTKYFNRILEIGKDFICVEPGVYFRDLEKVLRAKGVFYPSYPASKDICAIGGMVSNNSGGEKTLAHGKTQDYVRELKMVLSDGEEHIIRPISEIELQKKIKEKSFEGKLYKGIADLIKKNKTLIESARPKVSKNSAGYAIWNVWRNGIFDLNQLIVGAQGTLGIVTEAKLGTLPIPKHTRLVVIFLNDLTHLGDLVVEALKYKPDSLESYDDKTFRLALRFLPGIIRNMKGNAILLGLSFLPELGLILTGGLPKMVILAEFVSDSEEELSSRLNDFKSSMARFSKAVRILRTEKEAEKYWTIRRQSFKLLHEHMKGKETAPFIDDVIVDPKYLPEFLPKLNAILDRYKSKLTYTVAGHPGSGNFHVIPLMDLKNPEVRALIPKISEEVYSLVLEYQGSITAEHNDGLIRTPYLEKMYGSDVIKLFERVKRAFDPLDIFNPRKKVGGSLEYSLEHIKS